MFFFWFYRHRFYLYFANEYSSIAGTAHTQTEKHLSSFLICRRIDLSITNQHYQIDSKYTFLTCACVRACFVSTERLFLSDRQSILLSAALNIGINRDTSTTTTTTTIDSQYTQPKCLQLWRSLRPSCGIYTISFYVWVKLKAFKLSLIYVIPYNPARQIKCCLVPLFFSFSYSFFFVCILYTYMYNALIHKAYWAWHRFMYWL